MRERGDTDERFKMEAFEEKRERERESEFGKWVKRDKGKMVKERNYELDGGDFSFMVRYR